MVWFENASSLFTSVTILAAEAANSYVARFQLVKSGQLPGAMNHPQWICGHLSSCYSFAREQVLRINSLQQHLTHFT